MLTAQTIINFNSPTGGVSPELEEAFEELHRTLEYHVKNFCKAHGLTYEIDEN